MGTPFGQKRAFSRRSFLRGMGWAPVLLLPAPLRGTAWQSVPPARFPRPVPALAESRLVPHYPKKSPLDDVLRYVQPGMDEFVTELYATEIGEQLRQWGKELRSGTATAQAMAKFLDPSLQAVPLAPIEQRQVRSGNGVEVYRRTFPGSPLLIRDRFLDQMRAYLPAYALDVAEFQIFGIEQQGSSPLRVRTNVRYAFAGAAGDATREERIGYWLVEWMRSGSNTWRATHWRVIEETVSRAQQPVYVDVTLQALGTIESYQNQLRHGTDYWRTVLEEATGINVYGNCGVAAGDFDNDGRDDFYVCQPAGLPNRLYHNRGDGTFEDVTEAAGVGVLDGTASALFADFDNRGLQDLIVVCTEGPLFFRNQGDGRFAYKPEAFRFVNAPAGSFTHVAAADYDRDGRLDIYFCLYNYYFGLDQYHYPVPYFDARNGPPNFLFHNQGNGVFQDRTEAVGMNLENDRYTFACAWNDFDSDGWPDLYVVNDFGRNVLYRNNGDGTFAAVSAGANVDEVGAGMSACWLDFDNDGNQDIYAAGMWVPQGMRVFGQGPFHSRVPDEIRERYHRHTMGNSLYRNLGNGKFQNVGVSAGVEKAGWSWSTDALDFDHDGYADLYVANGYLSGVGPEDASSFFWRQVVAKSPENSSPSPDYERGWNAINEAVRSDASWNGRERNVFFANNRDGSYSDVSGVVGLDFLDDSRAFALSDIDQDGRLELLLKNRTAPQIRVLHNVMREIGAALAFRLVGTTSNRDAIGAAVTVQIGGLRQTKYLQAGSGFLSQHTKELFFGLGKTQAPVRASVRWPSGLTQIFENLPANHRVEIHEGTAGFRAIPFSTAPDSYRHSGPPQASESLPLSSETWLVRPLQAPDFTLPDLAGTTYRLSAFRGNFLLLQFWATYAPTCREQLKLLQKHRARLAAGKLLLLCVNVDDPPDKATVEAFLKQEGISLPVVLATPDTAGVYNIVARFLFDRRRDLDLPTSFLLTPEGSIAKIYRSRLDVEGLLEDIRTLPTTPAGFLDKALPMKGTLYRPLQRNEVTYGVAMFQRGYFKEAIALFQLAIDSQPDDPVAHYNLGTLYLQSKALAEATIQLKEAVRLRPEYAEAWNNLGMAAAQQGLEDEAIHYFRQCLHWKPTYVVALINLGNLMRHKGAFSDAEELLKQAVEIAPQDSDAAYSLGMLYARQNEFQPAFEYLEQAVVLRPDHTEALNNLGVLLVRQKRFSEAEEKFKDCIRIAPGFDQAYLNLAGLYVALEKKEQAREVLQSLLAQQPEHKLAREALQMLN